MFDRDPVNQPQNAATPPEDREACFSINQGLLTDWQQRLARRDELGVLAGRGGDLARLFTVIEQMGLETENVALFECGAPSQSARYLSSGAGNPGICHFMALTGNGLTRSYRAFEPYERGENLQWELKKKSSVVPASLHDTLCSKVDKVLVPGWQELRNEIERAGTRGEQVVIFSNHLISDPEVPCDRQVLNLPGLHVHTAGAGELCANRLRRFFNPQFQREWAGLEAAYEARGRLLEPKALEEDALLQRIIAESLRQNPAEHVRFLREVYGLDSVQYLSTGSKDLMLYCWKI